ncbi:MAG: Sb-PDE family phosphodiesterase [candidate division KSB1 bacterium]|nr:Sb-PDE family phosphodiesterase [candidate division KSB1 bacterium]
MNRNLWLRRSVALAGLLFFLELPAPASERKALRFPDIPGYVTLACDFHLHTVFSDGAVWPTVRVEEAWREGLDAIALTEHLEPRHKHAEVTGSSNASFDHAAARAQELGLILIRGGEITRSMPPGHFNAIFLSDADALAVEDWRQAIKAAIDQGAFVFWNHPGWRQPGTVPVWYDEHTELLQKGWIHGIEVVNAREYYPEVQTWCADKRLTLMGNSDAHNPMAMEYDLAAGEHRPMTLVFARQRNVDGIKEALRARRTVVYWQNLLIGEARYLQALFTQGVTVVHQRVDLVPGRSRDIQVENKLPLALELVAERSDQVVTGPEKIILPAERTVLMRVRASGTAGKGMKTVGLRYQAENLRVAPGKGLSVTLPVKVNLLEQSQP